MADHPFTFRVIDDRNVNSEVALMEWSPNLDLIALATIQGEVFLHRLTWQKVWSITRQGEGISVCALAWRPDGKILAVAYSTGKVNLCDVENAEVLHVLDMGLNAAVTMAEWVAEREKPPEDESKRCYQDKSALFLPKLPSLSKSYGSLSKLPEESMEDEKKLRDHSALNLLILGTAVGKIGMFGFGVFPCGEIELNKVLGVTVKNLLSTKMSDDLAFISVTVEVQRNSSSEAGTDDTEIKVCGFRSPLLSSRKEELRILALKYTQILSLLGYLAATIRSISDAWEDILLEIDSKLTSYAQEKFRLSSGTVGDDFLELLMFGTPTNELEKFLVYDLTEKGLKKLGHCIEMSYSNIQKLVLKHLQSVGQAIVYHLSEVRGMALWYNRFGVLGLNPESTMEAVSAAGSFVAKATEIQQVIDTSMRNFKAFFRWLYVVIMRLSDEPVPAEINKVTQQDLNFVAEFLRENFSTEWEQGKSGFNLERVGQYLKPEALLFPVDISQNPWSQVVRQHPEMEKGVLFPYHSDKSLVQQHLALKEAITIAFKQPETVLGQAIVPMYCVTMCKSSGDGIRVAVAKPAQTYSVSRGRIYTVVPFGGPPPISSHLLLVEQTTSEDSAMPELRAVKARFRDLGTSTKLPHKYGILDAKWYGEDTISLLLSDYESSENIVQHYRISLLLDGFETVRVEAVKENTTIVDTLCRVHDATFRLDAGDHQSLENIKAQSLAVSVVRKVACILFASRRRVRLLELDVEEEEPFESDDEGTMAVQDDSIKSIPVDMADTSNRTDDENKENSTV